MDITNKIDKFLIDEVKQSDFFVQNQKGWTKAEQAFNDGDKFNYMNMVLNQNKNKLKVGKWSADEEVMMGTWAWSKGDDMVVYITPFFDNDKGIDWQWTDYSGGEETFGDSETVPFKATGNPDKDFKTYMSVAKKILTKFK